MNGDDNVTVTNNVIQNDGKGGISLSTVHGAMIQGNKIYGPPRWGINLRTADVGATIENNTISNTPVGLLVEHDAVNTLIQSNVFNGVPLITSYYYQQLDPALSCPPGSC